MKRQLLAWVIACSSLVPAAAQVSLTPLSKRILAGRTLDLTADFPEPSPGGAAAAPVAEWRILEEGGGTLEGDDPHHRRYRAPRGVQHGIYRVQVTVRQGSAVIGSAQATLEVAGDPGLDHVLEGTLMPSSMGHDWLDPRPRLAFLGDRDGMHWAKGAAPGVEVGDLVIHGMRFVEDPAMGALDRTTLLATNRGLVGLTAASTLIPGVILRDKVTHLAVRPVGSPEANPHHVVYAIERDFGLRGAETKIYSVGPDLKPVLLAGFFPDEPAAERAGRVNIPHIEGLAMDRAGNIYLAIWKRIVRITPAGVITKLVGTALLFGWPDDGPAEKAGFGVIQALTYHPGEDCLYVMDEGTLRRVALDGAVETVMGRRHESSWREEPVPYAGPEPGASHRGRTVENLAGVTDLATLGADLLVVAGTENRRGIFRCDPARQELENLVGFDPAQAAGKEGPVGAPSSGRERARLGRSPLFVAPASSGFCCVYLNSGSAWAIPAAQERFAHLDLEFYLQARAAAAAAAPAAAAPASAAAAAAAAPEHKER